jgi:chromosome segregation ATPase
MERLQQESKEKDEIIEKHRQELDLVNALSKIQQTPTATPVSPEKELERGSSFKRLSLSFVTPNKKKALQLQEQTLQLQQQLSAAQDRIAKLETQLKTKERETNELRSSEAVKKQLLEDNHMQIKQFQERIRLLDAENKRLSEHSKKLEDVLRQSELDGKLWQNRTKEKENELQQMMQTLDEKIKTISELQSSIQDKDASISQLSAKLIDMKSQMDTINLQLRKFPVKVNKLLGKSDTMMILQKNPQNGLLTLNIQPTKGGAGTVHKLESIVDVKPDKTDATKFQLIFSNGQSDVFESDNRDEIIAAIRDFMKALYSA